MNEPASTPAQTYSSSQFYRPKPHERLAADEIGKELAPDAGIWQLYMEEAKEHNNELVEWRNKNLDIMLLFVSRSGNLVGSVI